MSNTDDKDLNDSQLFQEAVKGARPVKVNRVLHPQKKPKPIPKKLYEDERQVLRDSLSDGYIPAYEMESGGRATLPTRRPIARHFKQTQARSLGRASPY